MINLADALAMQFCEWGQISDRDEVIALYRQGLRPPYIPDPHHIRSLHNMANALVTRFHHLGELCDLDEAIALY
jgi:hypothetical protein